jgi:BMFP domain-containing protein YqiC
MQKDSKLFEDLARMGTSAFGSVLDLKREVEGMVSGQLEKILLRMHLVTKEEHDVTHAMAVKAREENDIIRKRLEELEQKVAKLASK